MRECGYYFVALQSIAKILCSLITDFIVIELKCSEYLCEILSERLNQRMRILLCCVVEHSQVVVLFEH
jgi:hypothetical protein